MSQPELLAKVVAVLDAAGIEYMVTGSIVSSSQGHPRSTHDVDVIVKIYACSLPALTHAFPSPEYYLDEVAAREAISRKDMFNLLEINSGDKVDFWILKDEDYDRLRFSRRTPWQLAGVQAYASRPEDTIVQKLRWAELSGGSEKQFNDAKAVYELQFRDLDIPYIEKWTRELGLADLWERLLREARPLE
jgi:hypothetical protein